MMYARGEAEEERLHAAFHAAALAGVPFRVRTHAMHMTLSHLRTLALRWPARLCTQR